MNTLTRYWIEPSGTIHLLGEYQNHSDWARLAGKNPLDMILEGWYQIKYYSANTEVTIELYSLNHLPKSLEDVLIQINLWGKPLRVGAWGRTSGHTELDVQVEEGYNNVAKEIHRAYLLKYC